MQKFDKACIVVMKARCSIGWDFSYLACVVVSVRKWFDEGLAEMREVLMVSPFRPSRYLIQTSRNVATLPPYTT